MNAAYQTVAPMKPRLDARRFDDVAISRRRVATAARCALVIAVLAWGAGNSFAGEADVVGVKTRPQGAGIYDFDVTVRSNDTGWDHYADRLEAVAPDGRILGTRELVHPHDDEQPFTRVLPGVHVPAGIDR